MASSKTKVKPIRIANETEEFFKDKPLNRYVESLHHHLDKGNLIVDGGNIIIAKAYKKNIYDDIPKDITSDLESMVVFFEGGMAGLMRAVDRMLNDGTLNTDFSIAKEAWVEEFRDACRECGVPVEEAAKRAIMAMEVQNDK